MSTRAKGYRTFAKAMRYALQFPGTVAIPLYQVSRFAQPQPFDVIFLRPSFWPRFVEVRSNQYGVAKPQTRRLAALPGEGYVKQLWCFRDHAQLPILRQWNGTAWVWIDQPWEET